MHIDKDWGVIAELVPSRTSVQCRYRWHSALDPNIERASGRKGSRWTAVEDSKPKDAAQTHGDKDWSAIAMLVSGRTRSQCSHRWNDVSDPRVALTGGSKGKLAEDEDSKLNDAVQTHGEDKWGTITALVP
jgi:hypothetical protein